MICIPPITSNSGLSLVTIMVLTWRPLRYPSGNFTSPADLASIVISVNVTAASQYAFCFGVKPLIELLLFRRPRPCRRCGYSPTAPRAVRADRQWHRHIEDQAVQSPSPG